MTAPPQWALCAFCGQDRKALNCSLGSFLGPLDDGNRSGVGIYVHRNCALWSSEVYHSSDGSTLRKVGQALRRGRQLRCGYCGERGATLGCRLDRCNVSYHLPCARASGCAFFPDRYLIACPRHVKEFKHELPQQGGKAGGKAGKGGRSVRGIACAARQGDGLGGRSSVGALGPGGPAHRDGLSPSHPRVTGDPEPNPESHRAGERERHREEAGGARQQPPRKRRKVDYAAAAAHLAAAGAAMAAARQAAAAAAAAAEADDDEAVFAVKERRRHAKDTARLAPVMLGGRTGGGDGGGEGGRGVYGKGFECVGGLEPVVQSLKEMVLLPLLYPGLMERLGLTGTGPPRGILLHGLPGTGKTLVVRALAGEIARTSPVPVALFARGGADVLGKYHGDAERTLRLLFEEARRLAPAVIFLDELDALAPRRSVSAGGGDQIYASVVATLLALLDGVADRGQVVVIGATNRPDNLDPALRRPGRFDREVAVGLPDARGRAEVLRVHTAGWRPQPQPELIERLAGETEGFAGADLAALCSSAVMAALRRASTSLSAAATTGATSPLPCAAAGTAAAARSLSGGGGGQAGEPEPHSHPGGPPGLGLVEQLLRIRERQRSRMQRAEDRRRLREQARQREEQQQQAVLTAPTPDAPVQGSGPERVRDTTGGAIQRQEIVSNADAGGAATEAAAAPSECGGSQAAAADALSPGGEVNDGGRRCDQDGGAGSGEDRGSGGDERLTGGACTSPSARCAAGELAASADVVAGPLTLPLRSPAARSGEPHPWHGLAEPRGGWDGGAGGADTLPHAGAATAADDVGDAGGIADDGGLGGWARPRQRRSFASVLRGVGQMFDSLGPTAAGRVQPAAPQAGGGCGAAAAATAAAPGGASLAEALAAAAMAALTIASESPAGAKQGIVRPQPQPQDAELASAAAGGGTSPQPPTDPLECETEDVGSEGPLVRVTDVDKTSEAAGRASASGARDEAGVAQLLRCCGAVQGEAAEEGEEQDWLGQVAVVEADWEAALAAAPKPCSRRDAAAAVSASGPPPPPPAHEAALVAPAAAAAVSRLAAAGIAVSESVATAAAAVMAATGEGSSAAEVASEVIASFLRQVALEGAVEGWLPAGLGNVTDIHGNGVAGLSSAGMEIGAEPVGSSCGPAPQLKPQAAACHLLLCGGGDVGQDAAATLLLRLLSAPPRSQPRPVQHRSGSAASGAAIHTINLPAIVLRSGGGGGVEDAGTGVTSLVSEALAVTHGSRGQLQVLYLPCMDTWALEQHLEGPAISEGEEVEEEGEEASGEEEVKAEGPDGEEAGEQGPDEGERSTGEGNDDGEGEAAVGSTAALQVRSRTCISPAWSVFMQQVSAAAGAPVALCHGGGGRLGAALGGSGGLLVLATCRMPPDQLPAELLEFFGAGSSSCSGADEDEEALLIPEDHVPAAVRALWEAACSDPYGLGVGTGGLAAAQRAAQSAAPPSACRHTVVVRSPPAAAVEAAATAVEAAVLPVVRRALEGGVLQALHDAVTSAAAAAAAATGSSPVAAAPAAGTGMCSGGSGHVGPLQDGAQVAGDGGGVEQPGGGGAVPAAVASGAPVGCPLASMRINSAELERGRRLLVQARVAVRCIAAAMLRRNSGCQLARAIVQTPAVRGNGGSRSAHRQLHHQHPPAGADSSAEELAGRARAGDPPQQPRAGGVVSLAAIAQRALEGHIHTLDQLRLEVQSTAARIRAIRAGAAGAPAAHPHHPHLHHRQPRSTQSPGAVTRTGTGAPLGPGPIGGSSSGVGYSRAAAAAAMWEDMAVAACEAASRALQLDDPPDNRRLMEAALRQLQHRNGGGDGAAAAGTAAQPSGTHLSADAGAADGSRAPMGQWASDCEDAGIFTAGAKRRRPTQEGQQQEQAYKVPATCGGTADDASDDRGRGGSASPIGGIPRHSQSAGLSANAASFLERRAAALASLVESRLAARGVLRRLLVRAGGDGPRGSGGGGEGLGRRQRQTQASNLDGTQAPLGGMGPGAGGSMQEAGGGRRADAAVEFDAQSRAVASRMLAACDRMRSGRVFCGDGGACAGSGGIGSAGAQDSYGMWVMLTTAKALRGGPTAAAKMAAHEAAACDEAHGLAGAAAEQLAACLEAAAIS